jgi:ligand-binding sensor domain-containing protein
LLVWRENGEWAQLSLQGPFQSLVTALAMDKEFLWVGTFDQGLWQLKAGQWIAMPLADQRITALYRENAGQLWVGTAGGLYLCEANHCGALRDERGWLNRHINTIRRLEPDNQLWVAAYPGLLAIDLQSDHGRIRYYGAKHQEADAGLVGPTTYGMDQHEGQLWVGTEDGLSRMSTEETVSWTDLGQEIPENWVNDVRADGEAIYILTLRSGFLRIDPRGTQIYPTHLMTSPGSMALALGLVLFGSNSSGLVVGDFSTPRKNELPLKTYGPKQGVSSSMVTALLYERAEDRLWVGGASGLTLLSHLKKSKIFSKL